MRKIKSLSLENKICLFGYICILLFFIILYFLMTESYEDIYQGSAFASKTVPEIISSTYHYIPRLGEFFQKIAVHFMTPQLSVGTDMFWRLLTAAAASSVFFFSSMFILGRKLQLKYKDVLLTLAMLLITMFSAFSETFTYRFSYANNYVLAMLATIAFLLFFRLKIQTKWYTLLGAVVAGFLFGISTEISALAGFLVTIILAIWTFFKEKNSWKNFFKKYKLQIYAVFGLLLGLAFYHLSNSIGSRVNGGYGATYDYISPFNIFVEPVKTISKMIQHLWYNIRYLFFAIPLMLTYIFIEFKVLKSKNSYLGTWQTALFGFCVLSTLATSLIAVHDDLYARFMVIVFLAILLSSGLFFNHILNKIKIPEKTLKRASLSFILISLILILDASVAFAKYNKEVAPYLDNIHYVVGAELVLDPEIEPIIMRPSYIFKLKQLSPFSWDSSDSYMKFGTSF